jgi:HK97 gp10 family phage protein
MANVGRVTVRVVGMPVLRKKLAQVSEATAGRAVGRALRAGALPIQNAAKVKAPKRTRTLSRSIHMETEVVGRWNAEVIVGTNLEYAAIHEFGGTIVPRKAKFLAIPLTDEARPYGSPRKVPRPLEPRIRGASGALVDETGVAQYALVKSVTIRRGLPAAGVRRERGRGDPQISAVRAQIERIARAKWARAAR